MTELTLRDLGVREKHAGCGCGCGAAEIQDATPVPGGAHPSDTYLVEGMTCAHCARSVADQVRGIDGVSDVVVDLRSGRASRVTVSGPSPVDPAKVRDAVEHAGYRVVEEG